MITGFLHLHSTLRWIVLALLIYTFIKAVIGLKKRSNDFTSQAKLGLFTMIALHIQLILGLTLFFMNSDHWGNFVDEGISRFIMMEHTPMMLLAIILGTLGHSLSKRAKDVVVKFRRQAIYLGFALFIILLMIPWPFMRGFDAVYNWI